MKLLHRCWSWPRKRSHLSPFSLSVLSPPHHFLFTTSSSYEVLNPGTELDPVPSHLLSLLPIYSLPTLIWFFPSAFKSTPLWLLKTWPYLLPYFFTPFFFLKHGCSDAFLLSPRLKPVLLSKKNVLFNVTNDLLLAKSKSLSLPYYHHSLLTNIFGQLIIPSSTRSFMNSRESAFCWVSSYLSNCSFSNAIFGPLASSLLPLILCFKILSMAP